MNDDDPFAHFNSKDSPTVIKPAAGRGVRPGAAGAAPAPDATVVRGGSGGGVGGSARAADGGAAAQAPVDAAVAAGLNPLLQNAAPLLMAATRVRTTAQHPNPAALRAGLADAVRRFENNARAAGVPNEQVIAARYVLCTFIDQCASSTPWGGSGAWASHSLLVQFHNEAWGGEKVFQLLSKLGKDVGPNRNLLELLHVVLALGFEGRYRGMDNGRQQLDSIRERLAQLLRQHGGDVEPELSPQWQGVASQARLVDGIPLWVVAALTAAVLLVLFFVLQFTLNGRTNDTFNALQAMDVKPAAGKPLPAPPPPVAAVQPRLAILLKPQIDARQLQVKDLADRSIVTIAGDGFFESSSAEVAGSVRPLLGYIGDALNKVPGSVLITGHTDNQPIRSLRFPSNWHLSQARAESVRDLLAPVVKPERMRAEGRAESQPVDDNTTPAGRARNRRVEITLFVTNN
ncbi:MAG: DotU family type VI secretion system protein [Rubrivivax sp.]